MNNALGEKPAPFGAPETTATPGEAGGFFESGRPRLGGLQNPVRFDDTQAAVINAAADTIIPPHPDWPTASELDLVTFVGRYTTPSGFQNKHFPFAGEDELKAGLDRLGRSFVDGDTTARTEAIAALEKAGDPLFEQLRALVYYGYYSRPVVTQAINRNLPAGRDYHGPPLPYGYLQTTEPWDEDLLTQAQENGSYLETSDVVRVDLSQLSWTK
ncbi:gluconate 2-dehydrogenase subunit 3 family protein [Actinomycetospora sp. TBRC 11914]|uniref:gluconate 2-dehydrogenase subunit 3 family protein n=1 Tax=Actinomycetospora sp. TBRC 11914 TaxID=2729387 RepID=UPI00145F151E|nr:gluconate 2-dehydrogenase subunit 3 family protein [Actinomycetospora sp. TBRC 11914]NMO93042.1 gluconate 2-dehydrogenase subunit 3 family protein [Actinomycetospora sp. TBRC 11914]